MLGKLLNNGPTFQRRLKLDSKNKKSEKDEILKRKKKKNETMKSVLTPLALWLTGLPKLLPYLGSYGCLGYQGCHCLNCDTILQAILHNLFYA